MSLMDNEFVGRSEVLFICYEDIIRCTKVRMLDNYRKKYANDYDHISPKVIEDMDEKNLLRFCLTSGYENPLRELFDADLLEDDLAEPVEGVPLISDQLRKEFESDDDQLVIKSPMGRMAGVLDVLFNQSFVEHVYIYSEEYDVRIHVDIHEQFGKHGDRCSYIHGDFETIIQSIPRKITFFMLNQLVYALRLFNIDKRFYEYTEVNIADVGYNYIYDELNEVICLEMDETAYNFEEMIVKFAVFTPFIMDKSYFTSLDYKELISETIVDAYKEAETEEERSLILAFLEEQSKEIEEVKAKGDHTLAFEFGPGDVIEPGRFPDDDTGFKDQINKL